MNQTKTVPAQRVVTRSQFRVVREPRSSEPARLLEAVIKAAEERGESLRRVLEREAN